MDLYSLMILFAFCVGGIIIMEIIARWMLFEYAGESGWTSLIPIYSSYVFYKITWGNGGVFVLSLIPIINIFIYVKTMYYLARSYDKGGIYAFCLILVSAFFIPILAFTDPEYIGAKGERPRRRRNNYAERNRTDRNRPQRNRPVRNRPERVRPERTDSDSEFNFDFDIDEPYENSRYY